MKVDFPHQLFLPLVYKLPQHDVVNIINRTRSLPEVLPFDIDGISIVDNRVFYTDGSCTFPNIPFGRLAGFAIIVDVAENDEIRCREAEKSNGVNVFPATLRPLVQVCNLASKQSTELNSRQSYRLFVQQIRQ